MKKFKKDLQHEDKVIVYHKVNRNGDHIYYFYDNGKKVYLDWGEIGHIPNCEDAFPHPQKDIDLILDDIIWED